MRQGGNSMSDTNPQHFELRSTPKAIMVSRRAMILLCLLVGSVIGAIVFFTSQTPQPVSSTDPQNKIEHKDEQLLERTGSGVAKNEPLPPLPETITLPSEPATPQMDPRLREELIQLRKRKSELALQALQAPLNVQVALQRTSDASSAARTRQTGDETDSERRSSSPANPSSEYDPSAQRDKEDFERRAGSNGQWSLNSKRSPGAQFELKSGTVLPGIMISGINSDLPGTLIAQISQHVFDTATGKYLLIPQGSRLYGRYDSRVIMGQERVLVAWNRVILPDGSSLDLGSMPGVDQSGYAGFTDSTNNHYMRLFGSALIMSMITGGMSYSVDTLSNNNNNTNNNNPSVQDEMGSALAATMGQASMNLLNKNLNIAPTLEIRPGYRFNLVVVKDIAFEAPYKPWR
jgi:type IV secretion system protein VirB10